ncbi:MAG: nickel pincer cofactor biosynthesis protein LarC [Polyangiaceae bacterium]
MPHDGDHDDHHHHGHAHAHAHGDHHHDHVHGDHHHDHAHDHDHHHNHAHGDHDHHHDHGHDHGPVDFAHRPDLPEGAGRGLVLYLDAPSGLAGDMLVAALVDLGVPPRVVADALHAVDLDGYHVHFGRRAQSHIFGTTFGVHEDAPQPARSYAEIRTLLEGSRLAPAVRDLALRAFHRLAEAEARVHRATVESVHFHEVGAVDSIVDFVAVSAALHYLGAELVVSPLPMGRGFTRSQHGVIPLPAPATLECLRGFPTYDGERAFEFVTPTGAAIVGALARPSATWPPASPRAIGWAAGSASIEGRPNLLRAVLVAPPGADPSAENRENKSDTTHAVLSANLDDATGELIASCIESFLSEGALDVWATPITMKKGRPGVTLSLLCREADVGRLSARLLAESTSLGVRCERVSRFERPRRMIEVTTRFGKVAVKVSEGPYGAPQVKPEYEDCQARAKEHLVTVREVMQASLVAALQVVQPG